MHAQDAGLQGEPVVYDIVSGCSDLCTGKYNTDLHNYYTIE